MKNWFGLDARPTLSPEQAAAFDRYRNPVRTQVLIANVVIIGLFYMSYAVVDALLLSDVTELSLLLRFGVVLPLALVLLAFLHQDRPIRHKEYAAIGVSIIGNIAWCVILMHSNSEAALHYYYAAVIFQMVVTIGARPPFVTALAASLVTFVVNYSCIWFLHGFYTSFLVFHMTVYVPAMMLTLIACHQLEAERLIAFVQMHENEMLKRELKRRNGELEQLSVTDPLTGLPNRRGTSVSIASMRAGAEADDLDRCALLLIDIDHFKSYNDGYGHAAGDDCLVRVAETMRAELDGHLHLGRHGGEEFLAILPAIEPGHARYIAERLRAAVFNLAIPHDHIRDGRGRVTVSIGIACGSATDDKTLGELVEAADRALYSVKAGGRNGTWMAEPVAKGVTAAA
ncbi:GGDEF domain-containing protein [Ciceribacter sp. L1K23]|uniref:GGDEF domain-containing protein n=1 Tax=Ciceribacter sp. L1K23 TaxID=2820276 RepID=UPI0020117CF1|nr:GGDEF domain-containing protein [Ciceribacter sp. L1K23]